MEKWYNAQQAEQELAQQWNKEKIYSPKNNAGPLFSIDTPPPTVSGTLHIGHIFSYTHTDIIARYKRMSGYSVFYPFGFDDNGLPTERYVEKKRKIRPQDLSRSEFIALCLEETKSARKQFTELWQRMGLSVDWDYCYSTISKESRKISQQSFIELYKKGTIYRKDEPALYCPTCRTTVAQAELEDLEFPSQFNDIVFTSQDKKPLIVSTTRPELLSSVVALLYHPNDERYQSLKNQYAIVPLFNQQVPIIADEGVIIEKGSGLVMVATYGDKTDIEWVKKHKLPYRESIGRDGKWIESTGILAGLKTAQAREKSIEELKKQNLLVRQKDISHAVNVHERCKKEIEYLTITQWFVSLKPYKDSFKAMGNQVDWFPPFMKARFDNWVENIGWDWCISRQRLFGIPFPVWYCKSCNDIVLPSVDELPVDPQEQAAPRNGCSKCKGTDLIPDTDVMDTWNTSSLTPYICFSLWNPEADPFSREAIKEFLPMSMRPQAHDIIRTWAFYTIVKAWMHNNVIPWKDIVISGHVTTEGKEKISKSLDQKKLDPETLLNQFSADVIRYWTASGSLGHDVMFSEHQLKIGQRLVTKLWNAFRFAQPHLEHFNPSKEPGHLGVINEWILDKTSRCFEAYTNYFKLNEFGLALNPIEDLFWNDFCDNYLELIKHSLFKPELYTEEERYATLHTLYSVGLSILQLYAPYLPFITESIYQQLYKKIVGTISLHQTKFSAIQKPVIYAQSVYNAQRINELVGTVRKLKTDHQLSLKTELNKLTVYVSDEKLIPLLQEQERIIKGITQAQSLELKLGNNESLLSQDGETITATVMIN